MVRLQRIWRELSGHKASYLCAAFLVLCGMFAGFCCAHVQNKVAVLVLGERLLGLGSGDAIGWTLCKYAGWRLLMQVIASFLALWLLSLPLSLLCILAQACIWALGWGCVFSLASLGSMLWIVPLFILAALCAFFCLVRQCALCLQNAARAFLERNVPKTAMDVYREGIPFFSKCAVCFVWSLPGVALEAAAIPAILLICV